MLVALITVAVQGGVHNVMDFGAKGDGVSYDTVAIRKAAAAVSSDSVGGTLLFPSGGTFLTGAFNVTSNTHVEIEHGATVLGSTRGEDWPLVVARTVWPQMGKCLGFGLRWPRTRVCVSLQRTRIVRCVPEVHMSDSIQKSVELDSVQLTSCAQRPTGHGSDCVPGAESCRLMHQALLFGWNAKNISISGEAAHHRPPSWVSFFFHSNNS